ncbi:extracellular catalytic domain type 1 short-chain-length polyhydroxyalkanoate depolymerase [Roseateles koreensis]|uniref:PHB depolymerase family esterase n=1 Tax=Roseateles koreensis TaxID=2987526 RepID=A0ABT5KS94_9BURK|nr:PHB depolymerase family esterase [Roseateles koreensis]MDC8785213.1 PHB depolymerase family esterase [Roseateles koreensis]
MRFLTTFTLLSVLCVAPVGSEAAPTWQERMQARMAQRRAAAQPADWSPDPTQINSHANPQAGPLGPGVVSLSLLHDGLVRKYIVHVPPSYDATRAQALVLALHGGGGSADIMADKDRYGLGRKADEAGFILVFPSGYSILPGGRFATWNAGGCCGDARDRSIDDVGFLRAVVAAVSARLNIDREQVFAVGMSNGGMMAHRLACDAADVFRAVASVAGTDASTQCQPSSPVSVLHIHAKDDTHVLFGGGAGPDAFRDTRKVMDFVSVPDTVARWVRRDQCQATPHKTLDRAGANCEAYSGCAAGARVQLCVTASGGHSWPGAQATRLGKAVPSMALDANEVIWNFFQSR